MQRPLQHIVLGLTGASCCAAAAWISYQLLEKHVVGSSGIPWFDAGCSADPVVLVVDCDAVLASPYAYFPPPEFADVLGGRQFPVALLGLAYYSTLLVWFCGSGARSLRRQWIHAIPLFIVTLGLVASLYYTAIMFRSIEEWCPWCLATHVLNLLIAICLALAYHRQGAPAPSEAGKESDDNVWGTIGSLLRIAAVATIAIFASYHVYEIKNSERDLGIARYKHNACKNTVRRIREDGRALLAIWQSSERYGLDIDTGAPVRGPWPGDSDHDPPRVVVFADFHCPACARFTRLLENRVRVFLDGNLSVVFRHFPLDKACNPHIRRSTNAGSCQAALVAEAIRLLGGEEAFWVAHDYLFDRQDDLAKGTLQPEEIARDLDVDPKALLETMQSQRATDRLAKDVDDAHACRARATPTVLVDGKPVDPLAVLQIEFWDALADWYWARTNQPRPAHTTDVTPKRLRG
ncbi:MAG: vitamin K epoxide reductase family protein [Planctomycetota bacterium]|jgi:protein-disulfide isomerase/uncharacterized membrane protein